MSYEAFKPGDLALWNDSGTLKEVQLKEEKMWGWIVLLRDDMRLDDPLSIFVSNYNLKRIEQT